MTQNGMIYTCSFTCLFITPVLNQNQRKRYGEKSTSAQSGGFKINGKKQKYGLYIYLFDQLYSISIIVMKKGNMGNKKEMVHNGGGRMEGKERIERFDLQLLTS